MGAKFLEFRQHVHMKFKVLLGGRLDAILAGQTSLSRSRVRKAIDLELVTVNGEAMLKPAKKVREGDFVEIDVDALPVEGALVTPIDLRLEILYEDDACMVISKPAGIAVHPGSGMPDDEKTILHGIAWLFLKRGIPFSTETALVHRLDKGTTGCLLIAKTAAAHIALQEQFSSRTVKKFYLAIVSGVPEHREAVIDAPIGRNLTDRTKMSVLQTTVSKDAKTSYVVLDASAECALLRCDLHTGRTHQIRVHLASIGHPLLGDDKYGSSQSNEHSLQCGADHLCLHAHSLAFVSPADNIQHRVRAPLPSFFRDVLTEAGLKVPKS